MFLYTMMPKEYIFNEAEGTQPETGSYKNCFFEGTRGAEGFVISRLISTNPADYLNKDFTPGVTNSKIK
ncbi:MAG: hypothetical protein BGN88_03880 [Clostridiales bacterium 43-6]|nr:MAG: hypothetical protein BGN88_03880 [Clostridiales bacterium 43-6]